MLATAAVVVSVQLLAAQQAAAATFDVNTIEDVLDGVCDSHCSLRDAVVTANDRPGRDLIIIPSGTYVLQIDGRHENRARSGDLDILETVVIRGAGRDATLIDGGEIDRVFHVHRFPPGQRAAEIEDLDITGGRATGGDNGGGLLNAGSLELRRVTLSRNQAAGSCGSGGGIANQTAALVLEQVLLVENSSTCDGGGLFNRFGTVAVDLSEIRSNQTTGSGGGLHSDSGTVSMVRTTVDANIADGRQSSGGGVWARASTVAVLRSTVSSNTASGSGQSRGGGVWADACTLTLLNSTLSGNHASSGVSSLGGGLAGRLSTVVISSCTFSGNSAAQGTSVWSDGSTTTVTNTLSDGNCELSLPLISGGGNIESPGNSCRFNGPSDRPSMPGSELGLGALADNGGPTRTHALLPESAARDAGVDWACPALDQRGEPRPVDGTGDGLAICDVGAFEARLGSEPVCTTWLPIAARVNGVGGSRWRTDMAVLNRSGADADLVVVFHGDDASAETELVLPRSAQVVLPDVVARLGLDDATGVVEIRSSQPVVVSSRTANHTGGGTLGQFVGGVTADEGLSTGETALLPQLSENEATTTNLVLSNTGQSEATVVVRLYDDFGWMLGEITVAVPAARVHLVRHLFSTAAGRDGSGWAEVELMDGQGLTAFASLVDRRSGDATTIPMRVQGR
jgi:CSLREA domain-containing protein